MFSFIYFYIHYQNCLNKTDLLNMMLIPLSKKLIYVKVNLSLTHSIVHICKMGE